MGSRRRCGTRRQTNLGCYQAWIVCRVFITWTEQLIRVLFELSQWGSSTSHVFLKKMDQPRPLFVYLRSFQTKNYRKNFSLQLDSNSIVRVDGVHADHLTTTATHPLRLMFEFTQWTQKELGVKWLKNGSAQVLKKCCQKWHDVCSLANCSHLNRCPGDLKKKQQKPLAQRSDQLSDKKFENLFFEKIRQEQNILSELERQFCKILTLLSVIFIPSGASSSTTTTAAHFSPVLLRRPTHSTKLLKLTFWLLGSFEMCATLLLDCRDQN